MDWKNARYGSLAGIEQLNNLMVLVLDCQTTGANPVKGRLLEIAWSSFSPRPDGKPASAPVTTHLVHSDVSTPIPNAIRRITGITENDMGKAIAEQSAWSDLLQAADTVARVNGWGKCPTVIHYARFETPFLKALHEAYSPGKPFPFHILCTHGIAVRLLPNLPRRGIRPG